MNELYITPNIGHQTPVKSAYNIDSLFCPLLHHNRFLPISFAFCLPLSLTSHLFARLTLSQIPFSIPSQMSSSSVSPQPTKSNTAVASASSATAAAAIAGNNRCAFAHSKDGKPYRSFRLVSVNHKQWTADGVQHTALNKSKTVTQNTTHLGPLRAAQKIFDSWCRHNHLVIIAPTAFVIQETTRGKQGKVYSYTGFREKLDQPRLVTVTNKATKTTHTVKYAYRSKVKALRKVGGDSASAKEAKEAKAAKAVKGAKGAKVAKGAKGAKVAKMAAKTTTTTTTTTKAKATKANANAKANAGKVVKGNVKGKGGGVSVAGKSSGKVVANKKGGKTSGNGGGKKVGKGKKGGKTTVSLN